MSVDTRIDPDTGLYTRHVFGMLFNHEIMRTRRYPSPLVLLRISTQYPAPPDNKSYENNFTSVARTLFHSIRQVDVPAQFGDDFLVLLPGTDESGGTIVGNRLLQRLQCEYPAETGENLPVAIYIGMATHSGGSDASAETILVQASEALEKARQHGTNALVNYRDIPPLQS